MYLIFLKNIDEKLMVVVLLPDGCGLWNKKERNGALATRATYIHNFGTYYDNTLKAKYTYVC